MSNDLKDFLPMEEFKKLVMRSAVTVNNKISDGSITKCKKMPKNDSSKIQTWWIHKSEAAHFVGMKRTERKTFSLTKIPQVEMEQFEIKNLKNFVVETGTVPFANMVMAVKLAFNRTSWDEILHQTGMKRNKVISLIGELKMAEEKWPGKYKTVIDYLNADRPCHPNNLDVREVVKKK